ncbi:hypothetical protein B0H17DRAFT_1220090 [Mycena rosella]|uniref:Uncharacterized protein n=1 Tax=Mycena rosella TaxID=1033263 RepID=A0AAD7FGP0_MYCRO|nr:hypothetical protein B0H17DRAFT_1220090 [Mycena rosella]
MNHYDVPDTDVPSSTTTSPTINILHGQLCKELHTNFDMMRNELITIVGSSIRKEMIIQQAILHPTLPPVHSFHELHNVSNVYIHPNRCTQLTDNPQADFICVLQLMLAALHILVLAQQLIWLIPTSGLQVDTVLTVANLGLKVVGYKPGEAFDTEADVVWAPIEIIEQEDFQTWYHPIFRHLLPILFALFGIMTWDILCMPISCSSIVLRVKHHNTHAKAHALITEVNKVLTTLGEDDRIMIFCRKRDMATYMAPVFNTDAYLTPR